MLEHSLTRSAVDVTLGRLYQIFARYVGETMMRVGNLELPPTAGRALPS
jgi:hypothetical protein